MKITSCCGNVIHASCRQAWKSEICSLCQGALGIISTIGDRKKVFVTPETLKRLTEEYAAKCETLKKSRLEELVRMSTGPEVDPALISRICQMIQEAQGNKIEKITNKISNMKIDQ